MSQNALLVIDMQNDYLWSKRKKMFTYDTDILVDNVNKSIETYREKGYDIIYIKHIQPLLLWGVGFSIRGTEGAEIYDGINIVSDNLFEKNFSDTFTSKAFREHVQKAGYKEMVLCGIDECGCVGATAKGAVKAGIKVSMLGDSIGSRFPEKKLKEMRDSLKSIGVEYI